MNTVGGAVSSPILLSGVLVMVSKQKSIKTGSKEDATLLSAIAKTDQMIAAFRRDLKLYTQERDNLIWQAQQRGITKAGDYELKQVVKQTRIIDVQMFATSVSYEQLLDTAKISLTAASEILNKRQLDKCVIKNPVVTFKVVKINHGTNKI